MEALLVLGNQLFDPKLLRDVLAAKTKSKKADVKVFMREDVELCTYFKFHKQKIVFFLAAMRTYAEELKRDKFKVHYEELDAKASRSKKYEDHLESWLHSESISKVYLFEIEDKFFERRIIARLEKLKIEFEIIPSRLFLTTREEFKAYLGKNKRPFMKTFYEGQRKRLRILVNEKLEPTGGAWSFDEDNRKALPNDIEPPPLKIPTKKSKIILDVEGLTETHFSKHPGVAGQFWLPVDREGARAWLQQFVKERLHEFGAFEDAIPVRSEFLYHSVLTPFLNTGLLTPDEVVESALTAARKSKIPLNSTEGFIRQIIGWREFVRGIYQNYSEKQDTSNFWNHTGKLKSVWYEGGTGVPPLDAALTKVVRYGYAHHIERLMVIGSMMLLLEVEPVEAHRWFMEMFIDSSDWVMGPNVYGMALFSDGGVFATKPYICGSNYYRKMGGFKAGPWCDGVDGLYWSFVEKHQKFFLKNPRLAMMARTVEKMDKEKKKRIYMAADELRERLVSQPGSLRAK